MSMDLTEALIDIEERLGDMLEYGLGKPTAFVATAAGWGDYHHLSRLQEWSGLSNHTKSTDAPEGQRMSVHDCRDKYA